MAARSLAARSLAAVSLMAGFYLLALVVIGGLLVVPYAEWTYAGRLHVKLALGCILGAIAIAWAIVPRPDRFPAPGPRLHPGESPMLFAALGEVARRTGQPVPREVYLVPDMNAWVANRGGLLGIGSRRVMGLGYPLLQVTSAAEFEAILAHEFGHYHGGDTRLGPWIYKTRAAIGRTLANLGEEGLLHLPFRWYGGFFLRITQAISRAQELTADRLAATVVGAAPLVEGLKKVHAHAAAFGAYWEQEAVPVLEAGYHAPLREGYERFLRAPRIQKALAQTLADELESGEGDVYDSHPPLRERIAAVEGLATSPPGEPQEGGRAIELLGDPNASERALLGFLARDGDADRFERLSWDDVAQRILVPQWRRQPQRFAKVLGAATLAGLPELLRSHGQELAHVALGQEVDVPEEYLPQVLGPPLGACVASALLDAGWTLSAEVGEPVTLSRGEAEIEPFGVVRKLFDEDGPSEWARLLQAHAIGELRLAGPTTAT